MSIYKTPDADVELVEEKKPQPFKAIIYGRLVSVVLIVIASGIQGVAFTLINFEDVMAFESPEDAKNYFTGNLSFLIIDIVVSFLILYFAGTRVRKYARGQEIKYALVLSVLTFLIHLTFFIYKNSFFDYPLWYNASLLLIIFMGIFGGARPEKVRSIEGQ